MAKQIGVLRVTGTLGGVTFKQDGTVAMKAPSRPVTSERTKENNNEFAAAARTGKIIREALLPLEVGDRLLTSRMTQTVRRGISLDDTNERGKRTLSKNEAIAVLPGFELNGNSSLTTVMPSSITADNNGIIIQNVLGATIKASDITMPSGGTHVQLRAIVATVNLDPDTMTVVNVDFSSTPESGGNAEMILNPVLPVEVDPDPNLIRMAAIAIKFFQEVNGRFYQLQNGSYDAGRIITIL